MGKFLEYCDKMDGITVAEQEEAILSILRNNMAYAVDLLTLQMMEGMDGEGKAIEPPYADEGYAELKLHLNPKGVVDLKLEGNFHASIYMNGSDWPVEFDATDWKRNKLVGIYGKAILQLNEKSINLLVNHIKEDVLSYYGKLYRL